MSVCWKWCGRALAAILLPCLAVTPTRVQAQDKHVVTSQELSKDAARPSETRGANEAALRQLFSSEQAQQALKSANIDYGKVDKAVGQLSDEDLASWLRALANCRTISPVEVREACLTAIC